MIAVSLRSTWFGSLLVLCSFGCQRAQPTGATPATVITQVATKFELTELAAGTVKQAFASNPGTRYLVVSVDFGREISCTGFKYHLDVQSDVDPAKYEVLTSQGIPVAIDREDLPFLNGTTLDCAIQASGTPGIIFCNPNEKVSSVPELRENQ